MSNDSAIKRREATWNPVTGEGLCHENLLDWPLKHEKPLTIFVNSMSDLFHEGVPDEFICKVFAVIAICRWHRFIVLTKRAERMAEMTNREDWDYQIEDNSDAVQWDAEQILERRGEFDPLCRTKDDIRARDPRWPYDNVCLGVSCENQQYLDERVPHLLACPAAYRTISAEPLLGPVDVTPYIGLWTHECKCGFHRDEMGLHPQGRKWYCPECRQHTVDRLAANWVIVGGESGPGARPMNPDWARSIRDQCVSAGVPFFFKQVGGVNKKHTGRLLDGREWNQTPWEDEK